MFQHIKVPVEGEKILVNDDFSLTVPDYPIIPFIEGDGIGIDITPVMIKVVDAAVSKVYGDKKKFFGWRYMLERNRQNYMVKMFGCQMKPSKLQGSMWFQSKGL